ncbi:5-methyltetrahydropteroyltriglutamate--homocysteine S-methyltransferase [Methylolobus aquaticus]|nr:5-methyltetrahydropteroyltriglutamate--homocysteine S-methyltransferase [Methylolobus aquaticus]
MAVTHNLGFPRIGVRRELKGALESYWKGATDEASLREAGRRIRAEHWRLQMSSGVDLIPVGDFAYYDHMLNMTALLGAIPPRFGLGDTLDLDGYFALARGTDAQPAMEMTKWFDTNYHYLVPELRRDTVFRLDQRWLFDEVAEAQGLGFHAKVVLVGPLTYLYLGKEKEAGFDRLELLPRLLSVYRELLVALKSRGVAWVQLDEPALALDLPPPWREALDAAYVHLAPDSPRLLLATYFGSVADHADRLKALPVAGLHIDAVRAPEQVDVFVPDFPADKVLSIGSIDGRNIWRTDLERVLPMLEAAKDTLGECLWLAPSCSLLHVPIDLELEVELDREVRPWLAFARQKLEELAILDRGLRLGRESIRTELEEAAHAARDRVLSPLVRRPEVRAAASRVREADLQRCSPFTQRVETQRARLGLPSWPTTTIGSFPQTPDIRAARAAYRRGDLDESGYRERMRAAIHLAIEKQEAIGLDVLVHGEAERNDMVEYFGEALDGFVFTGNGWVQSYGSRCVKPPIILGDVARTRPITTEWIGYAQSLTRKPVKAMLTGPVTMLQWSFVRDDQPRAETALQIALALREEVADLERAGVAAIQIDEPAFREGLPLRRADWDAYLAWAVRAFRLCSAGVADATQIHTHMCYSEFNDILPSIADLDADVITIETSRSDMALLDAFQAFDYPNDIGPGVYDIHSPRVPPVADMVALLRKAGQVIPPERLWVNPDCGLKTRGWPETEQALRNMVQAAAALRAG